MKSSQSRLLRVLALAALAAWSSATLTFAEHDDADSEPAFNPEGDTYLDIDTNANTSASTSTSSQALANVQRAGNLFGRQLMSSDNHNVGKVQNLVVDLESERILYVVVNTSKGRVAVPPQIFGNTSGNNIRLKATRQQIESAPQFTAQAGQQDQLGQASFVAPVYQHFRQNAWWQGSTPANQGTFNNVHRLNQLIGMKVENVNDQPVGKVSNVVVDMPSGRVMYVVMMPDSSLNLGNKLFAMPSDMLTLSSDRKNLVANIDQQKLTSAPQFERNSWPNLKDANFASQVYRHYGKQAWFETPGTPALQPTGR
jgi:sporulation protein YlmC with PRC-barrel domain